MKKIIAAILLLVVLIGFVSVRRLRQSTERVLSEQVIGSPTITPTPTQIVHPVNHEQFSLFVPYWSVGKKMIATKPYKSLIYFGVGVSKDGLVKSDPGYTTIPQFMAHIPAKTPTQLTIRMTDSQDNLQILESTRSEEQIIAQSLTLAKAEGFDGIILNLEVSALPFDSLIQQITSFEKQFYTAAKKEKLSFGLTIYGDTFYRVRPFDVKALAGNTDQLLVMAYDFHKSRGNPGPNFPLTGADTYGYDLQKMSADFLHVVPASKLTIVFGLFGYDWTVDGKNTSIGSAAPLSDLDIATKFLTTCSYKHCQVHKDAASAETTVSYLDAEGQNHAVWFEDLASAQKKQTFLKAQGIGNFSYWAYSYF